MPPSPDDQAKLHHAMALHQQGRIAAAEAIYLDLLRRHPRDHQVLYLLGVAAVAGGQFQRGAELIGRSIGIRPDFPPAHCNRGIALAALGRGTQALACYDQALALDPGFADAHYNRGVLLEAAGRAREAEAAYVASLAAQPNLAEALNNLGNLLNKRGEHAVALPKLEAAIALRPDYAAAHSNRGNALLGLDRPLEALDSFDRALSRQPDLAETWCNRGEALAELGRPLQAVASFERALALHPDLAEAQFGLSLVKLSLGDYADGFRLHEARLRRAGGEPSRHLPRPPWLGQGSLAGRRLLIQPELYLGDMIQFCRYARLAADRGAKVLLQVQPPLHISLATLGDGVTVLTTDDPLPDFDLYCPLMSLPLAFGTTLQSVPAAVPYLHADPARVAHWRGTIGEAGFRIGVCWHGSDQRSALRRCFPATMLRDIARLPGVRLISLQTGPGSAECGEMPEIEDYPVPPDAGGLRPFTDSAAMMMAVNLVISLDSSLAHLAGALGCPVWVVLKAVPDWRWGLTDSRTPWYPTARLFRQQQRNDWAPVFAAMRDALVQHWSGR